MLIAKQVWPPVGPDSSSGYHAICPAHQDPHGSLHVLQLADGFVVLKCFAGCTVQDVARACGLRMRDLFGNRETNPEDRREAAKKAREERFVRAVQSGKTRQQQAKPRKPPEGCTIAQYARVKQFDIERLCGWGLRDTVWKDIPAIAIPYKPSADVRFRVGMSGDRFRWNSGAKPPLYGAWRIGEYDPAMPLIIVEGESDCHALWAAGMNALGVPGADHWIEEDYAPALSRFASLFVIKEPDKGGETLARKIAAGVMGRRMVPVTLGRYKDPSGMWIENTPVQFRRLMIRYLQEAYRA